MIYRMVLILMLAMLAPVARAEQAAPLRLNNIPLDMPREEPLAGEYLEGIFQEKLMARLIDSVGIAWPSYHIRSTLRPAGAVAAGGNETDEPERMEIYFSGRDDGERIFWIRTRRPLDGTADAEGIARTLTLIEQSFGRPARTLSDPALPGSVLLLFVDPTLSAEARARQIAALPASLSIDDFREFWAMGLADRARLLGRDFRGAIAILTSGGGRLHGLQLELLDLTRAQSVFTLR
ncbi:MAG: hypothetical protein JNL25_07265 [Rhodospirillaceae bacterium]|nr:hypothetical protein [Rhodospirillaceae bacterium]